MWVHKRLLSIGALAVVCVGVALGGCAGAAPDEMLAKPSLLQRIEAAHTRDDHEKLATYYRGEAATARSRVEEHREMIKAYEHQVAGGRSNANMSTHCLSLIASYESIAADYERLAADHHQMAVQATHAD
jgi:hypothetical protein